MPPKTCRPVFQDVKGSSNGGHNSFMLANDRLNHYRPELRLTSSPAEPLTMHHDYIKEALVAATESTHAPDCLTRNYRIQTDGVCSCHVGKARFALDLANMSFTENAKLVAAEVQLGEELSTPEGYDTAYRRALVKHANKMGIKLD